ncbi:hypothetical protein ACJVC5_08265 [Peredibacter sp. HCB2-198]|uniref:hypothetical protein n=1 Tax=Peredibacter sp. HCB2-198 TaxID=3383025 RepID=UPI0038B621F9
MLLKTLALVMGLSVLPVYAGGESGGGGDSLEERVDEIRADILTWINAGGSKSLVLPNDITHENYVSLMTDILQPKKVVLGFEESEINVGGVPKTCRGYISKENQRPHILCNIARFKGTGEAEQYRLIHHEYAGLVRIEKNDGAASDYAISSQLTDYLRRKTVLRLAVVKKEQNRNGFDPIQSLEEARALYVKRLEASGKRAQEIQEFRVKSEKVLQSLRDKSIDPTINEIVNGCADELEATIPKYAAQFDQSRLRTDKNFENKLQDIEKSINRFFEAEECTQCDEVIREQTLLASKDSILKALRDLTQDPDYIYSDRPRDFYWDVHKRDCSFRKLFNIEQDKQTQDLRHSSGSTYSESLTLEEILSGKYDKALQFLGKNGPIKVERTARKLGTKPYSKFNGKKIKMVMIYDSSIFDGYSEVEFPEFGNPIHLIEGGLNENK